MSLREYNERFYHLVRRESFYAKRLSAMNEGFGEAFLNISKFIIDQGYVSNAREVDNIVEALSEQTLANMFGSNYYATSFKLALRAVNPRLHENAHSGEKRQAAAIAMKLAEYSKNNATYLKPGSKAPEKDAEGAAGEYNPRGSEKKPKGGSGAVNAALKGKVTQTEEHDNTKPDPEETAKKKARLEKKRGMKLDDHPEYKTEAADPADESRMKVFQKLQKAVDQKKKVNKESYEKAIKANQKELDKLEKGEEPATAKRYKEMKKEEVEQVEEEGKKDACYHKVKSRYSVWPSAYASGALVKCRKVGAANWGNKTKKEEFEPKEGLTFQQFQEKCWKGYEKKGMKTMFGKRYPNCVKKEDADLEQMQKDAAANRDRAAKAKKNTVTRGSAAFAAAKVADDVKKAARTGPQQYKGTRTGVKRIEKPAPTHTKTGVTRVESYHIDPKKHRAAQRDAKIGNLARNTSNPGEKAAAEKKSKGPKMFGEDWQKVNKSDKTDGMSQKAVNAYRRENPGSKLKTAVTGNPKKGSKDAKRRSSYCSRSEGQKDMHNIDCSKTPDKAICKARRRWKC